VKPIALLALTALNLIAQDPNARLACLVGPDAKMIYGIDVERYQVSQLAQVYPMSVPVPGVKKVIGTLPDSSGSHSPALILQGTAFSLQELVAQGNLLRTFRGFPAVALSEDSLLVLVETTLAVTGDTDTVSHIIDRITSTDCTGELAAKVAELSNSYDAWFAVQWPLDQLDLPSMMPPSERRLELAQSVDEVHGGIRFGTVHSVRVELTTKNPDDAAAVAVLGRWLPAMLEKEESTEANLVRAIENFATQSTGRTASMSFLLPETAVETALKVKGNRKVDFEAVQ
jgi:hypothetical protein